MENPFNLEVMTISNMPADTDLEAEVEPSVETEERVRAEEVAAQKRRAELERLAQSEAERQQAVEAEAIALAANLERLRQVCVSRALVFVLDIDNYLHKVDEVSCLLATLCGQK